MELYVLDTNFRILSVLDSFESIIWTDRFQEYGDFELYSPANTTLINQLQKDYYLYNRESEYSMIIESIKLSDDNEAGKHITVTGRSLESILDRRIIWTQTVISGNLQTGIKKLLDENAINPNDVNRKIPNLIFETSTDPAITSLTIDEAQYTGDNLYETIVDLCLAYKIGFKVTLNNNNQFVFKLYSGTDRSYIQETNPYVVFSPNFENIINSNYLDTNEVYKTITLVAGEGEGSARKTAVVGSGSGLNRRELFTDARDISSNVDGGTISAAQYNNMLVARGTEKLEEHKIKKTFEGQVESTVLFSYGKDFFLGDIVQVVNEYGIESRSRVTEIIRSEDEEGFRIYPTFEILDNEEDKS